MGIRLVRAETQDMSELQDIAKIICITAIVIVLVRNL